MLYAGTFARDHRRVDVSLGGTVSSPEPFTITGLRLRIRAVGTDARPFLRAPSTCVSAWTFSVSYLFDAPLTARDRLPCPALHGPT